MTIIPLTTMMTISDALSEIYWLEGTLGEIEEYGVQDSDHEIAIKARISHLNAEIALASALPLINVDERETTLAQGMLVYAELGELGYSPTLGEKEPTKRHWVERLNALSPILSEAYHKTAIGLSFATRYSRV